MRFLTDIWENQEAEIEQNMDQNCKHWDLLLIDPFLLLALCPPEIPQPPEAVPSVGNQVFRPSGDTSHLDQAEVPLNCEL